jgi:threonine synthase
VAVFASALEVAPIPCLDTGYGESLSLEDLEFITAMRSQPAKSASQDVHYIVPTSGVLLPVATPQWRDGPSGSHLNLTPGQGLTPADIDPGERSLWRYGAAIRVDPRSRISLGEGWTPVVNGRWGSYSVNFKLEYLAPTGSFKDRGTSVLFSYLRSVGVDHILEDSSGNAGASMAAYAAASGIKSRILAPASAPAGKISQMVAMGADVGLIQGDRQAVAEAALREAEHIFYASHNWQPFFIEGTKTLAFELWEQTGFKGPDAVVVPCGYGSNVLGLWLGFNELLSAGQITRIPRIYAVQAAASAPFHAVWESGGDEWVPIKPQPTMADGIASVRPVRIKEVIAAARGSGGAVIAVTEDEILRSLRQLLAQGLFVEPTSASAGAALSRLIEEGTIGPDENVVVVLTGTGLKATDMIAQLIKR